jgi:ParB-like chromosome segregation protein Spo0J
MELGKAFIDGVEIRGRHRPLSPERVDALVESIKAIGLQQPISVWATDADTCVLVAGHHRLEACKKLGWQQIDCFFVDLNELDRELWEIDENLMRAELTPVQQAEHLKRRKEIWEAKHQSMQDAPIESKREDGKGHRAEGFASDTAEKTGVDKTTINRAISRAEKIPESIREKIEGTKLDSGAYMDSIKDLPEEEMAEKVEQDLKAITKPASKPKAKPDPEKVKQEKLRKERERLMQAWNAASDEIKDWFISEIVRKAA